MGWGGGSSELQEEDKPTAHTDAATLSRDLQPGWGQRRLDSGPHPRSPAHSWHPACRRRGSAFACPPALIVLAPLGMSRQSGALHSLLKLAPSTIERVPLSGASLHVQLRVSGHSCPVRPPVFPTPAFPHLHPVHISSCSPSLLLPPRPPNSPLPACPHRWTPWRALSPSPASQSGFCLHHSTKGGVKG